MKQFKLTAKQEAFAQYVADGLTATEAYRRAYDWKGKDRGMWKKASETRKHPGIVAYIAELQEEAKASNGASRAKKRRILDQIMSDRDADPQRRIDAIKTDNLMTGDNKPIKVEGEITLGSILREILPTRGLPSQDPKP